MTFTFWFREQMVVCHEKFDLFVLRNELSDYTMKLWRRLLKSYEFTLAMSKREEMWR